jgi:hypothetical protein
MSGDPIDYSRCTLAELRDVAAHIDRKRFSERASRVDDEISKREQRLPLSEVAISFRGGGRWDETWTATWPFVELRFSTTEMWMRISAIIPRRFAFARTDVISIRERRRFFTWCFQIVHMREDCPRQILFFPRSLPSVQRALLDRGWPLEPRR